MFVRNPLNAVKVHEKGQCHQESTVPILLFTFRLPRIHPQHWMTGKTWPKLAEMTQEWPTSISYSNPQGSHRNGEAVREGSGKCSAEIGTGDHLQTKLSQLMWKHSILDSRFSVCVSFVCLAQTIHWILKHFCQKAILIYCKTERVRSTALLLNAEPFKELKPGATL